MHEHILEKLFESQAKTRLLKLFLRNTEESFAMTEIRARTQLDRKAILRNVLLLQDIGLVKSTMRKKVRVFSLNPQFVFYNELSNLVLKSSPASKQKMLARIRALGRVKLAVLSGIFIDEDPGARRVDLLIVGDAISDRKMKNFMRSLEAEAGIEISYTLLETEEFIYRYKMFDKFVHDILEKPHEKMIDKLGEGT